MSKWLCIGRRKSVVIDYWDVSHMSLVDLPKEVWDTRNTLKYLNISSNAIKDIPKAIFLIEQLEEIDFSENEIIFLPPAVSNLSFLTTLNLSKNSLSSIPDAIKECHSLLTLDLSCNPLGEVCEGVMELKQLKKLILSDIQMEDVPANIGRLEKLEILEMRENLLQSLPLSISHLSLLEKLDLGTNEFSSLPHGIGALESLTELWLDTNTISLLPEEMGNLYNLRFLELSENHLMVLPESMGCWVNLTHLYLGENLLSLLPASVGKLSKLTILMMDKNRLGGLPDTLDGLSSLKELSFAHNHLSELPPSFGGMRQLFNLNLDDNMLTQLPDEIGLCTSLSILSVRNNHLIDLPQQISNLSSLSILNVIGNHLHHLPYTLTNLTKLTAIWIAANQSRPILDLQLSLDDKEERCLTCFLFPQQGEERSLKEASSCSLQESENTDVPEHIASLVNFDPKVKDQKHTKISRDVTPFPKELHSKAMQWRATRDILIGGEGVANAEGGVTMRTQSAKRGQDRNSLLKAFANPLELLPPLEEEGILDASSRKIKNSSKGSRDTTPHPATIPEGDETISTPTNTNHTPLPPPMLLSPEESLTAQSAVSGPYLDPPLEFTPSVHAGMGNGNLPSYRTGTGTDSLDNTHKMAANEPLLLVANGNNNNNNNNNNQHIYYPRGNSNSAADPRNSAVSAATSATILKADNHRRHQKKINHHFSKPAHTLSHSNHPNMESRPLSNTEPTNSAPLPWYTSPTHSEDVATSMRPQVKPMGREVTGVYPRPHSWNLPETQSIWNQKQPHSYVKDGDLTFEPETKLGGSMEVLNVDTPTHRMGHPGCVDDDGYRNHGISPRGHPGSKSFDNADILRDRTSGESIVSPRQHTPVAPPSDHTYSNLRTVRGSPISPDLSPHPPPAGHHDDDGDGYHHLVHTRTRSNSPSKSLVLPLAPVHLSPPSGHYPTSHHHHTRSLSEADDSSNLANSLPFQARPQYSRLWRDGGVSSPDRHTHSAAGSFLVQENVSLMSERAKLVLSNESIFQDPQQRNAPVNHHNHIHCFEHCPHRQGHMTERGTPAPAPTAQHYLSSDDVHTYYNLIRHDENSGVVAGRGFHETTPLQLKQVADTGKQIKSLTNTRRYSEPINFTSPKGNAIRVVLVKNPSLGFGLTGGKDGNNAIQPGDMGFHVYRVVDGLPAQKSGKMKVGDRLLEVNGVKVSNMVGQAVLSLLMGPDKVVSLVLYREASVTLL